MKLCFLLSALCILCCPMASAQWQVKPIWLPDSLSGVAWVECVTYVAPHDAVYVGGHLADHIVVLDGTTGARRARVPVGHRPHSFWYSAALDRLYCANAESDTVTIIDCNANTPVANVAVPGEPWALCGIPDGSKVYCACYDGGSVAVLDGSTGSLLHVVSGIPGAWTLCYDPASNRMYCASDGGSTGVAVLDCATDSVVANLSYPAWGLCLNTRNNKVYCSASSFYRESTVTVLSDSSLSVVREIAVGSGPVSLCYDPQDNKVYCANRGGNTVTVIDGDSDRVLTTVQVGSGPYALWYNAARNRVYCANYEEATVSVIDCHADSVVTTVPAELSAVDIAGNSDGTMVYCAIYYSESVMLIDAVADTVTAMAVVGSQPSAMAFNATGDKLYCVDWYGVLGEPVTHPTTVMVVDPATGTLLRRVPVGQEAVALACNPADNKLYCANMYDFTTTVIDARADTVLATLPASYYPFGLVWNPVHDLVYCGAYDTVFVYDGAGDSVVARLGFKGSGADICGGPENDKVYVAADERLIVIDCSTNHWHDLQVGAGIGSLCWNPDDNKVYSSCGETPDAAVLVFDGASDSLLGRVPLESRAELLCYNPTDNCIYCATYPNRAQVVVIDGATDTVVARVEAGPYFPSLMVCDPARNRVYCFAGDSIVVVAGGTHQLLGAFKLGAPVVAALYDSARGRMLFSSEDASAIFAVTDSGAGIAQRSTQPAARFTSGPTIVRGVLFLPRDMTETRPGISDRVPRASLLNATGRKVLDLKPGANDVRSLAPGVYFVREAHAQAQAQAQAVRKVVLTK